MLQSARIDRGHLMGHTIVCCVHNQPNVLGEYPHNRAAPMPLSECQCAALALQGVVQNAPEAVNDALVRVAGVLGHHQCVDAPLLHKLGCRLGVKADEESVEVGERLQKVALFRALSHAANKQCQSDVDSRGMHRAGRECTLKGNSFSCQAEPCTNTATTRAQSCVVGPVRRSTQ